MDTKADADISSLISELKEMPMPEPDICAVYFLIHDKQVIYVGATTDLIARVRSHWKPTSDSGGKPFSEVRYIECDDMESALLLETKLIRVLRPQFNRQFNPDSKRV